MAADIQATAIHLAYQRLTTALNPIGELSGTIVTPISKDGGGNPIFMHSDNVAILKTDTGKLKAEFNAAVADMVAAFAL